MDKKIIVVNDEEKDIRKVRKLTRKILDQDIDINTFAVDKPLDGSIRLRSLKALGAPMIPVENIIVHLTGPNDELLVTLLQPIRLNLEVEDVLSFDAAFEVTLEGIVITNRRAIFGDKELGVTD